MIQDAWIGDISDADALVFYREYIGRLKQIKFKFEEDKVYRFKAGYKDIFNETCGANKRIAQFIGENSFKVKIDPAKNVFNHIFMTYTIRSFTLSEIVIITNFQVFTTIRFTHGV